MVQPRGDCTLGPGVCGDEAMSTFSCYSINSWHLTLLWSLSRSLKTDTIGVLSIFWTWAFIVLSIHEEEIFSLCLLIWQENAKSILWAITKLFLPSKSTLGSMHLLRCCSYLCNALQLLLFVLLSRSTQVKYTPLQFFWTNIVMNHEHEIARIYHGCISLLKTDYLGSITNFLVSFL